MQFFKDSRASTPQLIRGKPNKVKPTYSGTINNRSKYSTNILMESPNSELFVNSNNASAGLYLTKAFGAPGVLLKVNCQSTSSFCLAYFRMGPGHWAMG